MLLISRTHSTNVTLVFNALRELDGLTAEIEICATTVTVAKLLSMQNLALPPDNFSGEEKGVRKIGYLTVKKGDGAILKKQEIDFMLMDGEISITGGQKITCSVPVVIADPGASIPAMIVTSVSKLGESLAEVVSTNSKIVSATFTDENGNTYTAELQTESGKDKWVVSIDGNPGGGDQQPPVSAPAPEATDPESPAAPSVYSGEAPAAAVPLASPKPAEPAKAPENPKKEEGIKGKLKKLFTGKKRRKS